MDNEEKSFSEKKRKKTKILNIIIAVLVVMLVGVGSFYAGTVATVAIPTLGFNNSKYAKAMEGVGDVSDFKKLFQVRELIYKLYDGQIDENKLVEGAIKGMTNSLNDPYTVFMNEKEFSDFSERNEGSYVGVGLQVGVKNDKVVVIAAFENSPADKAGVKSGDVIDKINGEDILGSDLEKAVATMKNGKAKEKITLTLERADKGGFDVDVYRDTITMTSVKGEMLDNNVGYIQINMFDENTGDAFNNKLKELQGKGMKGLVLDLRENPGGLLSECIKVVSNFVEKDKILTSTVDKFDNKKEYNSKGGNAIGLPLVVLTDGNTASASEIVAGVVRDYKAGTLIGTTTFGKGIVQTVLDLKDGTGFKVTISKYYTPNGENIHKKGIAPDIEISIPDELKNKGLTRDNDPQFKKALETINEKIK